MSAEFGNKSTEAFSRATACSGAFWSCNRRAAPTSVRSRKSYWPASRDSVAHLLVFRDRRCGAFGRGGLGEDVDEGARGFSATSMARLAPDVRFRVVAAGHAHVVGVDGAHHLEHLARGLLFVLVVAGVVHALRVAVLPDVAMRAADAERAGEPAHDGGDFVPRHFRGKDLEVLRRTGRRARRLRRCPPWRQRRGVRPARTRNLA